jgi:ketoreductase RED1
VIGASWTALFLAHGLNVVVNDPQPNIETTLKGALLKIAPTLRELGLPYESLDRSLRFEADLERAVAGADLVQENGPERPEWKQQLWARIENAVPKHALLLSSSSARPATEQGREMKDASRLLVGHPFNPPHLIPLVEVVPGERTGSDAIADAVAFYEALGKVPRVLKKEIQGFVANRLQRAIMREACYLVQEGVVTIDELDDIVTSSIGLRWAANGPFSSFHIGGGPKGLASFFQHLGKNMAASFNVIPPVELDEKLQQRIVDQAAASFGKTPIAQMERQRDNAQVALLRALASQNEKDRS